MRFLQQLDRFSEMLAAQFEKRKLWLLCGFSILYLLGTCLLVSRKLMGNDELYTFYISRLPSLSDVWSALMTGGETIPPFFYILTRTSVALFGASNISIRLPEVLGFWVMCLCLFKFVSRRSSALYGFVALLFPLVSGAYRYAYEARPYGLVLGFSGLAILCWQSATIGVHRKLSLIGLALSLAGALSNHYYAVLVFFPLVLGEIVRSFSRQRLDLPVWGAIAAAAMVPLLIFLPLIQEARTHSASFYSHPHLNIVYSSYRSLLVPSILPLVAVLVLSVVYLRALPIKLKQESHEMPLFHELTVAFGFTLIPVLAFILAKFVTDALIDRYAIPAVLGFSILLAFAAAYSLIGGRKIISIALVIFFCSWYAMLVKKELGGLSTLIQAQNESIKILQSEGEVNLPIVASEPHIFMQLAHYAPQNITSRLVYLADPEASLRYLGHSSVDQGMLDLIKPWFHLRVEDYHLYTTSNRRFLVYGSFNFLNWLVSKLKADNMRIEFESQQGDNFLLLVSPNEQFEGSSHVIEPKTTAIKR
jgi:4-amino-4-deoxy-L-arabinose transferase-like glycosyltransferase